MNRCKIQIKHENRISTIVGSIPLISFVNILGSYGGKKNVSPNINKRFAKSTELALDRQKKQGNIYISRDRYR